MTSELIFLIVSAVVAGLILLSGVAALLASTRTTARDSALQPVGPGASLEGRERDPDAPLAEATRMLGSWIVPDRYQSTIRAVWWATITAALIAVGVSGAYPGTSVEIFALGGLAVVAVVVFHELIPARWRSPVTGAAEAASAIGLVCGLVVLTGWGASPFAMALVLPVAGVALGARPLAGLLTAVAATAAYGVLLVLDPAAPFDAGDLLAPAAAIGLLWLVTVLAVVFAAQQRGLQSAALQLSVTDPLTGLFNRAQIFVDLDREVRRSRRSLRPFCLLMVDMDGLKALNDTLGHERGDAAIRGIAGVIRRSIRAVDSAYRYAGDEFVLLLPETDFAGAFVVAEKVRQGAAELGATFAGEGAPTTVSIGLVSHPEDGSTDEELMLAVDRAMYAAKAAGKNQISGYPRPSRPAPGEAVQEASSLG